MCKMAIVRPSLFDKRLRTRLLPKCTQEWERLAKGALHSQDVAKLMRQAVERHICQTYPVQQVHISDDHSVGCNPSISRGMWYPVAQGHILALAQVPFFRYVLHFIRTCVSAAEGTSCAVDARYGFSSEHSRAWLCEQQPNGPLGCPHLQRVSLLLTERASAVLHGTTPTQANYQATEWPDNGCRV
jgi:hypothetical protein